VCRPARNGAIDFLLFEVFFDVHSPAVLISSKNSEYIGFLTFFSLFQFSLVVLGTG
jgi:hypothetical protein